VEEHRTTKSENPGSTPDEGLQFLLMDFTSHIGSMFDYKTRKEDGDIYWRKIPFY
jgi:hypothetical protein